MRTLRADPAISKRMAGIKQKGTAIETAVAIVLRELHLHYRKNVKSLPGNPDFANRSHRWAVFVNGCFWHHHTACARASIPKSNTEFWMAKFQDNRRRDAHAIRRLRRRGYCVVVVWECHKNRIHAKLSKIHKPSSVNR